MATVIAQKTCTPCRGGVPPLTPEEAADSCPRPLAGNCWSRRTCCAANSNSRISGNRLASSTRSADWRNKRDIIQTSVSAGVMRQSHCRLIRSRACTKTISSWQRRSISWQVCREALCPSDRRLPHIREHVLLFGVLQPDGHGQPATTALVWIAPSADISVEEADRRLGSELDIAASSI